MMCSECEQKTKIIGMQQEIIDKLYKKLEQMENYRRILFDLPRDNPEVSE